MYVLYTNEETAIIKIKQADSSWKSTYKNLMSDNQRRAIDAGEVIRYNEYYHISSSRPALRAKAVEIKNKWLLKVKAMLATIEAIEIK